MTDGPDVVLTVADDGVGLNLLSAIAPAHGGALAITGNEPGLRLTITLPWVAA